jgi:hypothetical protein
MSYSHPWLGASRVSMHLVSFEPDLPHQDRTLLHFWLSHVTFWWTLHMLTPGPHTQQEGAGGVRNSRCVSAVTKGRFRTPSTGDA